MPITDKFASVSTSDTARPAVSFLDTPGKAIAAASINITDATNWPTSKVHIAVYNKTADGKKDITTQTDWIATRSGVVLSNLTLTGGTDRAYVAGAIVEITPTYKWAKDLYDGVALAHNIDGTHKVFTEANIVPTAAIQALAVNNSKLAADISPLKFANPHKFNVSSSVGQTLAAATYTKIQMNTEVFDTGNNFDGVTNFRFTAPVSGFYTFFGTAQIGTAGIGTTATAQAAIYKNGVPIAYGQAIAGSGNANTLTQPTVNALLQLAATDYVELWGYCSEGGRAVSANPAYTYLHGFLVSTT